MNTIADQKPGFKSGDASQSTFRAKRKRSARLTTEQRAERQRESLRRAVSSQSMANITPIIEGFEAKGIPAADIRPRENVFTFDAWKALGRAVKKGEHGVKILTVVESTRGVDDNGQPKVVSFPRTTTVFHISQTEPIEAAAN